MSSTIADAFVFIFTRGDSLRQWKDSGLLEREWAMLGLIAEHYKRIVLVTHGGADDAEIAATLPASPEIICNHESLDPATYASECVARVSELLRGGAGRVGSCVIKTNQMDDAGIADALLFELRTGGVQAALIARGGILRSRFAAKTHGPASPEAIDAGHDEHRLCAAADLIVGTTGVMIDELAWRCHLSAERTRVIPNYVLDAAHPPKSEERDERRILCAGRLIKRKQIELVLRGAAALPESMRDGLVLEIVGSGPEQSALAELGDSLDITVEMPGALPHPELLLRMRKCSIFCQASAFEGHPKTVLEAMNAGCAVIVASTPGLGGVVQNGMTGLVVPPKPESFTFAISGLIEDPFLRATLGGAARDCAHDRFGIKRIARLELDAHRAALALSQRRAADQTDNQAA